MNNEIRNQYIIESIIVTREYPTSLNFIDRSGQVIDGVKVLRYYGKDKYGQIYYEYECHCGNKFIANSNKFNQRAKKSCGCLSGKNENGKFKIVSTDYPSGSRFKDLSGQTINGIKILNYAGIDKHHHAFYECECRCGSKFYVNGTKLIRNEVLSCGCRLYIKNSRQWNDGLNHSDNNISYIYHNMIRSNEVCEEWSNFNTGYKKYYQWMMENGFGKDKNILRKDSSAPYSPENCVVTDSYLSKKFQRNSRYLTVDNYTYPVAIWSLITGLTFKIINNRVMTYGWSDRDAVLTPVKGDRGIDKIQLVIPPEIERLNGCRQ